MSESGDERFWRESGAGQIWRMICPSEVDGLPVCRTHGLSVHTCHVSDGQSCDDIQLRHVRDLLSDESYSADAVVFKLRRLLGC